MSCQFELTVICDNYAGHYTGDNVIVMLRENLQDTAVGQFCAGMHIGTEERVSDNGIHR